VVIEVMPIQIDMEDKARIEGQVVVIEDQASMEGTEARVEGNMIKVDSCLEVKVKGDKVDIVENQEVAGGSVVIEETVMVLEITTVQEGTEIDQVGMIVSQDVITDLIYHSY
jgi:uncharacterized Zn ribbon protein